MYPSKINMRRALKTIKTVATLALASLPAWAAGGAGLPWEGPLTQIKNSISGPVAWALAIVGVALSGGMLFFQHHELGTGGKVIFGLIMGAGVCLGAGNALTVLFPAAAGALI
jgi:type IV secretion system protein VirB2